MASVFKPITYDSAAIPFGLLNVVGGKAVPPASDRPYSPSPGANGFGLGSSYTGPGQDPAKTVIVGGTSSPYVGSGNGDKPFASYEKGNRDMVTAPDMGRWQDGQIGQYWAEDGLLQGPYAGGVGDMGVRPGLSPPMNAVQAARIAAGQDPGLGSQNFSPLPNPSGQGGRRADPNSGPGIPGGIGGSNPNLPYSPRRY